MQMKSSAFPEHIFPFGMISNMVEWLVGCQIALVVVELAGCQKNTTLVKFRPEKIRSSTKCSGPDGTYCTIETPFMRREVSVVPSCVEHGTAICRPSGSWFFD
jgi:hypothetical protein